MTSEGLGEMFEGDSADTCAHIEWGLSRGSGVALEILEMKDDLKNIFLVGSK